MIKKSPNNMVNYCADSLIYLLSDYDEINAEEAEKIIGAEMDRVLENTPIGSVLLNTNYSVSCIPCESYDTAWRKLNGQDITYEMLDKYNHWQKYFVRAHQAGIEPYSIAMRSIRRHGANVWFSIRMNDYHYLAIPPAASSFWEEHPEYRIGEKGVYDFSHPEVRQYHKSYILELCERYEIDGIEFDMIRGSSYFAGNSSLSRQQKVEILTDYLTELRCGINKIASDTGRSIQTAVRVFSDIESNKNCFFDIPEWVKTGSVDKVIVTNFHVPSDFDLPIEKWRNRLEQNGIKESTLIAGTDFAVRCVGYPDPAVRTMRMDEGLLRGFSSAAINRGADGIYLFNLFLMKPDLDLRSLGSSEGIRRYVRSYKDPGNDLRMPWKMSAGEMICTSLSIYGVDNARVTLRLGFNGSSPEVKINGYALAGERYLSTLYKSDWNINGVCTDWEETAPEFLIADVPVDAVINGYNDIVLNAKTDTEILWLEVEVSG